MSTWSAGGEQTNNQSMMRLVGDVGDEHPAEGDHGEHERGPDAWQS